MAARVADRQGHKIRRAALEQVFAQVWTLFLCNLGRGVLLVRGLPSCWTPIFENGPQPFSAALSSSRWSKSCCGFIPSSLLIGSPYFTRNCCFFMSTLRTSRNSLSSTGLTGAYQKKKPQHAACRLAYSSKRRRIPIVCVAMERTKLLQLDACVRFFTPVTYGSSVAATQARRRNIWH